VEGFGSVYLLECKKNKTKKNKKRKRERIRSSRSVRSSHSDAVVKEGQQRIIERKGQRKSEEKEIC